MRSVSGRSISLITGIRLIIALIISLKHLFPSKLVQIGVVSPFPM